MIVFAPILKMLLDHGWSSYRLRQERILPEGTLSRLRSGLPITTTTIDTICRLCHCQPGDLITYRPDPETKEQE
jgi:DNA-binding Xre family transcriptional regulator